MQLISKSNIQKIFVNKKFNPPICQSVYRKSAYRKAEKALQFSTPTNQREVKIWTHSR